MVNTKTVGKRTVDLEGFAGDAAALVRTQRPQSTHVVRAVGEFDQNDADILHHRHDHFAEVFGLRLFLVAELQFIQLRNPLHQLGNAFAKKLLHILVGGGGIFNHVMQ